MSYTEEEARIVSERLLFPHLIKVAGVHAPRDLLLPCLTAAQRKEPEPLSGIYCQFRDDGKIYIGQAKNVSARHTQHVWEQVYRVEYLAYRHFKPEKLDAEEKDCIQRALDLRLPIANYQGQPSPHRERKHNTSDYDRKIPYYEQNDFVAAIAKRKTRRNDWMKLCKMVPAYEVDEWDLLSLRLQKDEILEATRTFLKMTVPRLNETEGVFWIVSVGRKKAQRRQTVLSVRTGMKAFFRISGFEGIPSPLWAEVRLDSATLLAAFKTQEGVHKAAPWCQFNWSGKNDWYEDEYDEEEDGEDDDLVQEVVTSKGVKINRSPITRVDVKSLVTLRVPLPALIPTFTENTIFWMAASMAAIALMRHNAALDLKAHNHLVAFQIVRG